MASFGLLCKIAKRERNKFKKQSLKASLKSKGKQNKLGVVAEHLLS
jgi:hypothetical protein